jgi:hypothetical protein
VSAVPREPAGDQVSLDDDGIDRSLEVWEDGKEGAHAVLDACQAILDHRVVLTVVLSDHLGQSVDLMRVAQLGESTDQCVSVHDAS